MAEEREGFGEELRQFRKEHYLTQRKMAMLLGLSTNHISVLERGIKCPRASTQSAFLHLKEQEGDESLDSVGRLTKSEKNIYDILWQRLTNLEPMCRRETMELFLQLLETAEK